MNESVPKSGPPFEALMKEIDTRFSGDGLPIAQRPFHAVRVVAQRFKLPLPLVRPPEWAPPSVKQHADLTENIHAWYETAYGDRIKMDFSPGGIVVEIDSDLYVLSLPRIYGEVHFFAVRQFIERGSRVTKGPSACNIVQLIKSLTPAKAASLSGRTLDIITKCFIVAMDAHDRLEASQSHSLIKIARGDIQTAMNNLMDTGNRFGDSKWSSLQAAEKILKAAIELEGGAFRHGHDLARLCSQLESLRIIGQWKPIIEKIQCSAGIRYGEITCSRDEALAAHHASLELVTALAAAGVKFKRKLR